MIVFHSPCESIARHSGGLQAEIFEEAFRVAEITQFIQGKAREYESSLKYYRDMQNVMDTAIGEAVAKEAATTREERLEKGREEERENGHEEKREKLPAISKKSAYP